MYDLTAACILIKRYEGLALHPYYCPAGLYTIGYGHVIKDREGQIKDCTIEQAEEWLEQDMLTAARAVTRLIQTPLTVMQYNALISFTFNVGAAALQRSTLRQCINREEHERVPHELLRWIWAGGRKLSGLVKRRSEEAILYKGHLST